MDLRTTCKQRKEKRDMEIYKEFTALMAKPNASATKVNQFLMQKYEIYSTSTLWVIRKRVEAKLKKGGKQ